MIDANEFVANMTAKEKFNVACRIKNIDQALITKLYFEIKEKGTYDDCDYECIGEYSVPDVEWGYGEKFGGYVIYLQDLYDSTYNKIDKEYQEIIDIAREYGVEELYISINDINGV